MADHIVDRGNHSHRLNRPLSFLFRRSPESMGLKPDGGISYSHMRRRIRERQAASTSQPASAQSDEAQTTDSSGSSDGDFTTKQALKPHRSGSLSLLRPSEYPCTAPYSYISSPSSSLEAKRKQTAANLVGAISLAAVPVIIFTGYISDRVGRPLMLTFLYSASAVSLLLITLVEGTWPIFLAMLLFVGSEAGSYSQLGNHRRPLRTRPIRHHPRHDGAHLQRRPHRRTRSRRIHLRPPRHIPTRANNRHHPNVHSRRRIPHLATCREEKQISLTIGRSGEKIKFASQESRADLPIWNCGNHGRGNRI